MLLNEIATVTDISTARKKEDKPIERDKDVEDRLLKAKAKHDARKKDKPKKERKKTKSTDEVGERRRSKMSQADQFRDIARQLRDKD